jgi:uncharacterized protein
MIPRTLTPTLRTAASTLPVVAVTGPRQSGKTTLCRATFPDHAYVNLEPLDTREFAQKDPRGFLSTYPGPVIFDEVQRAPDLFSYLQDAVDRAPEPGRFILTGSQHFGLSEAISQSLAGRVRLLHLLPLSLEELLAGGENADDLWRCLWRGGYPRIHDQGLDPGTWRNDYLSTYVQRDVRQVLEVSNLAAFTTFVRLVAGRTGQELNLSALGADAGVSHNTARAWLSVLETSFVVFQIPPWLSNTRKRVIKAPKLHWVDQGLACQLLGIQTPEQLALHPQRGALFESWVASEVLKWRLHRGLPALLFHRRETRGVEVDLLVEAAGMLIPAEVKSGQTVASDFLAGLTDFAHEAERTHPHLTLAPRLVYGGTQREARSGVNVLPWRSLHAEDWGDITR